MLKFKRLYNMLRILIFLPFFINLEEVLYRYRKGNRNKRVKIRKEEKNESVRKS